MRSQFWNHIMAPSFVGAIGLGSLFSLLSVVACGSQRQPFDSSSSSSSGAFGTPDAGSPGETPSADGCTAAARLVYVVSQETDLYSFTPNTGVFAKIGHLDCPTTGLATPNS